MFDFQNNFTALSEQVKMLKCGLRTTLPKAKKEKISAKNVDGERFCRSETRRPYESAPAIVNSCDYVFRGDTYHHRVTYQQLEGEENRRELVDTVVHTMEAF